VLFRSPIEVTEFDRRYQTIPHSGTFNPSAGCPLAPSGTNTVQNSDYRSPTCLALPDDEVNGRSARRLIATPNDAYLINDLVDGIVAPFFNTQTYASTTTVACAQCASGSYPPFSFDPGVYSDLVRAAKQQFSGGTLMVLHLGADGEGGPPLDLDVLELQTGIAAGIADYTGFWEMPLGVRFLKDQLGVFAEPQPTSGDYFAFDGDGDGTNELYRFEAYFPGNQDNLNGWYQAWVSNTNLAGRRLTITVSSTDESSAGMLRMIYAGTNTYHLADLSSGAGKTSVTFSVGSDPVVMAMESSGSWHLDARVYFQVVDADDGTEYGPDTGYWTFVSGVDSNIVGTYERERDVMLRIRHR
jgi:hypothetical protein